MTPTPPAPAQKPTPQAARQAATPTAGTGSTPAAGASLAEVPPAAAPGGESPAVETPVGSPAAGPATDARNDGSPAAQAGAASPAQDGANRAAAEAAGSRIVVHYSAHKPFGQEAAKRAAAALRARGFEVVDIRGVDYPVRQSSIRYFFDADRAASIRVQQEFGGWLGAYTRDETPGLMDMSHFRPTPRQRTIEVWVPDVAADVSNYGQAQL